MVQQIFEAIPASRRGASYSKSTDLDERRGFTGKRTKFILCSTIVSTSNCPCLGLTRRRERILGFSCLPARPGTKSKGNNKIERSRTL
mmetsp:Transcript_6287/g.10209  ORF Transcript_6287/g.10209 Transcript_6287/m.10209 type:complete len:88 (-) Transcript_6287:288-551(-)